MSHPYQYVVFAPGKQPTVEEIELLEAWATLSKQRYAIGINGENGCLALAFEAGGFTTALATNQRFAKLLGHWKVRGCEVRERLPFIKKPTAFQPLPGGLLHEPLQRKNEPLLKRKQIATQEALGRAGLKFQQTILQHAWLQRVASVVPYALIGLGALLTIAIGFHFSRRLLNSPSERRQQTIQRVANDAMRESLARESQAVANE